jgi:hypothetical protein
MRFWDVLEGGANAVSDDSVTTDEEREANALEQRGNLLWEQLYNDAPSAFDLAGYGMYGGGMDDAWFQNWLDQSGYDYADGGGAVAPTYAPRPGGAAPTGATIGSATTTGTHNKGGAPTVDQSGWGGLYEADTARGDANQWDPDVDGDGRVTDAERAYMQAKVNGDLDYASFLNTSVGTQHYGVDQDGNYIDGSYHSDGMPRGGGRGIDPEALRSMAEEAFVREQMGKDPLWGLQVNQESALASAQADPNAIAAQNYTLGGLRDIYEAGGYTDEERGQNRLAQQDAARFAQSQRAASQQQAAMRGMNQSGASMMGALMADQGGANRAADAATRYNIAGHQRSMDALTRHGDLGGQMRQSSWNEDTTRRTALDNWNQYRTGQIQQRQQQWGAAQQDAYGNRQTALSGLTGQWGGSVQRADQQEQQGKDDFIGAVAGLAGLGDDEDD